MATLTIDHFHLLMYGDSDYWGKTPILQPEQPLWKIPPLCWYCQALYHKQQRTHSTKLQLSSQLPTAVGLQKVLLCFLTQSHTHIHATSNNMTSQQCSTHHVRVLAQKHICKPQHGKWSLKSTLRASRSWGSATRVHPDLQLVQVELTSTYSQRGGVRWKCLGKCKKAHSPNLKFKEEIDY